MKTESVPCYYEYLMDGTKQECFNEHVCRLFKPANILQSVTDSEADRQKDKNTHTHTQTDRRGRNASHTYAVLMQVMQKVSAFVDGVNRNYS